MTNYLSAAVIVFFAFTFSSCEKKEESIILPKANDSLQLETVSLGSNYDKQIFLNIQTKEQTVIENNIWDLYFDADENGHSIYMNGGNGILIANSGSTLFKNISTPSSLNFRWDAASGIDDSLVLKNWRNKNTLQSNDSVYVVDRGIQITDDSRYMLFKITSVNSSSYQLKIADIDGNNIHDFTVSKDKNKAHVYFSFENKGTYLNLEPNIDNWHISFLRYRWIYYQFNPPLLYTVTGIYINNKRVKAAVDSTMKFCDINPTNCAQMHFSSNRDAMGFDWKVYNFLNGKYVTRNFVNYIIATNSPLKYYKIRFIDFYDDKGLKGTPRFEEQGM